MSSGPLAGLRVLEFAGLGPGPFCGMLLADLGADVLRIDRIGAPDPAYAEIAQRGRRSVALDLKSEAGAQACLDLIGAAEALIEGFRPGVMERLGLGPDTALARNPRLVYGRMTGWGQTGPLAQAAAHDINYIALAGVLGAMGSDARPAIPMNLVGDLGGGALYLAFGLLAGLTHARTSGRGQVIDCAMSDGAASLMAMVYGLHAQRQWHPDRGRNTMNGAAPFYDVYRCSDGSWVALGAIEPQFFALFLARTGLDPVAYGDPYDMALWPRQKAALAALFASRPRAAWCELLEGGDTCFAPVLNLSEAPEHPHNRARQTFVVQGDVIQPAPAPRYSATPGAIQGPPPGTGEHTRVALADWGMSGVEIERLLELGAAAQNPPS